MKSLINEVRQFKKIAGLLKEYVDEAPESVLEAFKKAGVDMSKLIFVEEEGESGKPYKAYPDKIAAKLQKIKNTQSEEKGVWFDYDAPKAHSAKELGLEGIECKLSVVVGDDYEYVIYQ